MPNKKTDTARKKFEKDRDVTHQSYAGLSIGQLLFEVAMMVWEIYYWHRADLASRKRKGARK